MLSRFTAFHWTVYSLIVFYTVVLYFVILYILLHFIQFHFFFFFYTVSGILALVLLLRSVGLSSGETFGAVLGLTGGISGTCGIVRIVLIHYNAVRLILSV